MSQAQAGKYIPLPSLATVPEGRFAASDEFLLLQDAVIQTDLQFNIIGWNSPAEVLYHLEDGLGRNLFELVDLRFVRGSLEDLRLEMACSSCWTGEMIYTKQNGQELHFRTTANYMVNEKKRPVSIMIVSHNITEEKRKEKKLETAEVEYRTLVNTLSEGVVMMKTDGQIAAANQPAARILGITTDELTGRLVPSTDWDARRSDGSVFPIDEFPALVTLRTGKPQKDVIMGVAQPGGRRVWISINSKPIAGTAEGRPDAVVVSFKDITEERAKQQELQQAETLLRVFIENSRTAAWIYDEEGQIVMANDVYNRITNAPPGGAAGLHLRTLFPGEFGERLLERNRNFLATQTHEVHPKDLVQADGTVRTFQSYLFLIQLPDGRRLIGGQALDITDTRVATEKLKASEALFRTFMSSTPTFSWIYDEQYRLVFANPRFLEELGYGEEALGKTLDELNTSEAVKDMVRRRIADVLTYNNRQLCEDITTGPDGQPRFFAAHWFQLPMADGVKLVGGHAEEITEKKRNNARLRELKERYEFALKATSDALWDYDLRDNQIFRSDQFSLISGYSPDQIEPRLDWWFERIHPGDQQRVQNRFQQFLSEKQATWNDEYRFRYADGSYRHLADRAFAVYDEAGELVRLVGAIQDITERLELQQQLVQEQVERQQQITYASIRAQELEREKISKELHDNINQILLSAKLYMNSAREPRPDRDEFLHKAIEYQVMAIEEIRKLSKALNTSLVGIMGLRDNVSGIVYNLRELQGITVDFAFSDSLEDKLDNEQKLMVLRIVQEQTNNIIKYANATHVFIDIADYADTAVLYIRDNGIGFDTRQPSRGVGLANMRNRAQALQGTILIDSAPGEGCRLELTFPLRSAQPGERLL